MARVGARADASGCARRAAQFVVAGTPGAMEVRRVCAGGDRRTGPVAAGWSQFRPAASGLRLGRWRVHHLSGRPSAPDDPGSLFRSDVGAQLVGLDADRERLGRSIDRRRRLHDQGRRRRGLDLFHRHRCAAPDGLVQPGVSSSIGTDRRYTIAQRNAYCRGRCKRHNVGRDHIDGVAVAPNSGAGAIGIALSKNGACVDRASDIAADRRAHPVASAR